MQTTTYEEMRKAGVSHKLAEMLALRQPPTDKADRTFLADLAPRSPEENRKLAKKAERQGYSVSGATYLSGLARFPGDGEAFVRSRDDVKRLLEKRGSSSEGAVECDYRPSPEELQAKRVDIGIAPDILEDETQAHERRNKVALRGRERVDFKQDLYNLRKPSNCKTPFTPALHDKRSAKLRKRKVK